MSSTTVAQARVKAIDRDRNVRRRPLQKRSEDRVTSMIEAAAQLFDERGYAGVTTEAIAKKAGVPIGTLYQFFKGKPQILIAVAERVRDHVMESAARAIATLDIQKESVESLVDLFVDIVADDFATFPGFATAQAVVGTDAAFSEAHHAHHGALTQLIAQGIAVRNPRLSAEERQMIAHLSIWFTNILHVSPAAKKKSSRALLVRETKRVLVRYLTPYLDN